jgi:hypothetical protein
MVVESNNIYDDVIVAVGAHCGSAPGEHTRIPSDAPAGDTYFDGDGDSDGDFM